MVDTSGAIIVAMAHRAERRIADALRDQAATSAAHAVPVEPSRLIDRGALRRMIKRGAIHETGGAYWLDEAAYGSMRDGRRVLVVFVLIAIVLVIAAVALLNLRAG